MTGEISSLTRNQMQIREITHAHVSPACYFKDALTRSCYDGLINYSCAKYTIKSRVCVTAKTRERTNRRRRRQLVTLVIHEGEIISRALGSAVIRGAR